MKSSLFIFSSIAIIFAVSSANAEGGKGHHKRHHQGNGAQFFQKLDTNKDGKLSRDEFASKSAGMFAKADANGDGVVTRAEFDAAKKNWVGRHMDERFEKHDKNNDGKVTRAEATDMPERRFKRLDANNDGALTRQEIAQRMGEHRAKHGGERGQKMRLFERLDANNDGKVTKQEMNAQRDERFKKMDVNQDGFITREEMRQSHPSKRGDKKGPNNRHEKK